MSKIPVRVSGQGFVPRPKWGQGSAGPGPLLVGPGPLLVGPGPVLVGPGPGPLVSGPRLPSEKSAAAAKASAAAMLAAAEAAERTLQRTLLLRLATMGWAAAKPPPSPQCQPK